MTPSASGSNQSSTHPLETINSLIIKAMSAISRQSLIFIIVNDTYNLTKYDRGILWDMQGEKHQMLGVSGQTTLNAYSEMHNKLSTLIASLNDKGAAQVLGPDKFSGKEEIWEDLQAHHQSAVLWLPIYFDDELVLGLWLERWTGGYDDPLTADFLGIINKYLLPGYGAAWSKHQSKITFTPKMNYKGKMKLAGLASALFVLFVVRIPLRVVAPCEVIPDNPVLVTAPLEGVIDKIIVEPGEKVEEGTPLFDYDKRVPLQNLKVAQNEIEIIQADINRTSAVGLYDKPSLAELGLLQVKLRKAQLNFDFASYQAGLLTVSSPVDGFVSMDDPAQWRGKPVLVGEKIMTIVDPSKTLIRMWVPENDNLNLNPDMPVKIILNIEPQTSYAARFLYIATETSISEKHVASFIAEAQWKDPPSDEIKPGLKGTAILYGNKVSLFYYLFRKPFAMFRSVTGL
jgi:hypothetical protein